MKILCIGDLHFKKDNTDEIDNILNEIIEMIEKKNFDIVVSLGDTLDTHERIYQYPLYKAISFYFKIAERCPLYVIVGNHDRLNNSDFCSEISSMYCLKKTPNIYIIDKPLLFGKKNEFIAVPYVPNGKFEDALKMLELSENDLEKIKIIFCHQEFKDAQMGAIKSKNGDIWTRNIQIISGHIHEYQILDNIIYTGMPYQLTYGESPKKYILSLDFSDEKMNIEKIILKSMIQKKIIHLTINQLPDFYKKLKEGKKENEKIKIILHINKNETASIQKNTYYIYCKQMVDVINISTDIQLANDNFEKENNILKIPSIEELVIESLSDDIKSINNFKTHICG